MTGAELGVTARGVREDRHRVWLAQDVGELCEVRGD
jgi:hypothetical protein